MTTRRPGAGQDDPGLPGQAAASEPDSGDPGIGEMLRRRRTERSVTLSDAERDTRINRNYLQALEGERWDALPAPIYTRGFLRSYARHLALDPEEMIAMLPAELPRPRGLEPLPGLLRRRSSVGLDFPRTLVVTAVAIVVTIAVAAAVLQFRAASDGETTGSTEQPQATASGDASAVATPDVAATVPPAEPGTTPDFTGVTIETARETLSELDLLVNVLEIETDDAPLGRVFHQSPAPGEPLQAGDTVLLVVSAGPP